MKGYDRWKLDNPPEWDLDTDCRRCGAPLVDGRCLEPTGECARCQEPEGLHPVEDCPGYEPDGWGCGWTPEDDLPDPDAERDAREDR